MKHLMQDFARQAIQTKYLGPTNFRGSRVKATCCAGTLTVGWDHALDSFQNHARAAEMLLVKLSWQSANEMLGGQLKDGTYVFTLAILSPNQRSKK